MKQEKADANRTNIMAEQILSNAVHFEKAKLNSVQVASRNLQALAVKSSLTEQKQERALQNANSITQEKVIRLAKHNENVQMKNALVHSECDNIKQTNLDLLTAKMAVASTRHDQEIQKVVSRANVGDKLERGSAALARYAAKAKEIEGLQHSKMALATERREKKIEEVVAKASVKKTSPLRAAKPTTTTSDINEKIEEATVRREILLAQRSEQAGLHNEKVKEIIKISTPVKPPSPRKMHHENELLVPSDAATEAATATDESVSEVEVSEAEPANISEHPSGGSDLFASVKGALGF